MSDERAEYVNNLELVVNIQEEQIGHLESLVRTRATVDAWTRAVRAKPSLLTEFEALLDSEGDIPPPPGHRCEGLQLVTGEADATPATEPQPEPAPATAMHAQLAGLID
ncbi:MAG: hypothetical protein AAF108_07205 [Planctomycetota bacterium]